MSALKLKDIEAFINFDIRFSIILLNRPLSNAAEAEAERIRNVSVRNREAVFLNM